MINEQRKVWRNKIAGSRFQGMVPWKVKRDEFQNHDNVSGMGDQVTGLRDMESGADFSDGNPKQVEFISRDETNANVCNKLGIRWWRKQW